PLRDVQPDGCLPHHRRARAEPRRSGDAGYGVTGLSWVGRSEDPTRRTPPSPRLEPDLLVGRGKEVTGDQAQPRLRDPRSPCVEDGDLPDRRDRDALVDELLDSMQDGLAPLAVALRSLFLDEPLDVRVAPVRVEAAGGDERVDPRRRVAV